MRALILWLIIAVGLMLLLMVAFSRADRYYADQERNCQEVCAARVPATYWRT